MRGTKKIHRTPLRLRLNSPGPRAGCPAFYLSEPRQAGVRHDVQGLRLDARTQQEHTEGEELARYLDPEPEVPFPTLCFPDAKGLPSGDGLGFQKTGQSGLVQTKITAASICYGSPHSAHGP